MKYKSETFYDSTPIVVLCSCISRHTSALYRCTIGMYTTLMDEDVYLFHFHLYTNYTSNYIGSLQVQQHVNAVKCRRYPS